MTSRNVIRNVALSSAVAGEGGYLRDRSVVATAVVVLLVASSIVVVGSRAVSSSPVRSIATTPLPGAVQPTPTAVRPHSVGPSLLGIPSTVASSPKPAASVQPEGVAEAAGDYGNLSTLELLNDSVIPGPAAPDQQGAPYSVAFDPRLDLAYVAGGTPLAVVPSQLAPFLSVVNPETRAVVGTIPLPTCEDVSSQGLAFDPNNGLLYVLCTEYTGGGRILAIDPANSAVEASIPVQGYSTGSACKGLSPYPAAVTLAPALDDVFVLVADCATVIVSGANVTTPAITVDVVNDRTDLVSENISVGPSTFPLGPELAGQAMAFDQNSGLLYVDVDPIPMTVALVDPLAGRVATTFVPGTGLLSPGYYPPLLYSPAKGAVVTDGAVNDSTELFELDPVHDRLVPLAELGGYANCTFEQRAKGDNCGLDVYAGFPTNGPSPDEVTIAGSSFDQEEFALVYNLTTDREAGNLSTGSVGPGVYDPIDAVLLLTDTVDDRLVTIESSPLGAGLPIPLGVEAAVTALDPATGTLYVATDTPCLTEIGVDCANASVEVVPLSTERPVAVWPIPPGGVTGMLFDPLTSSLFVLLDCGFEIPVCPLVPGANASAAVLEYSLSGRLLGSSALPSRMESTDGITLDPSTGDVVFVGGSTSHEGALYAVDPATAVATPVYASALGEPGGSVVYDANDNLLIAAETQYHYTVTEQLKIRVEMFAFNATDYNLSWNATVPTSLTTFPYIGALGLAFDSSNDTLFVANETSLLTVDPRNGSVVGVDQLASGPPGALAYDASDNGLVVTAGSQNLTELNASSLSVLKEVSLLPSNLTFVPVSGLSVDPTSGLVVVGEQGLGCVAFVRGLGPQAYPVEFEETGLPEGTPWAVDVGGVIETSLGSVTFYLPNGSYPYQVSAHRNFTQSTLESTGTFTVAGAPVHMPVAAYLPVTYWILFDETAGPPDAEWNVTLVQETGPPVPLTCRPCPPAEMSSVVFDGPNGTYRYAITGLPAGDQVRDSRSDQPDSIGTLNVSGGVPYGAAVDFAVTAGPTPNLTFRLTGAPAGSSWCVRLAVVLDSCTTGVSIRFADLTPTESYSYAIRPPSGWSVAGPNGSIALGNASVVLRFHALVDRYPVTFIESGLAEHKGWKVVVGGKRVSGDTPILVADLPNGTYGYAVTPIAGYTGAWSGTVTVNGIGVAVSGAFVRVVYAVTFEESGLPAGTIWSVTLHGEAYLTNSSSLVLELPNGTYAYHVGAVPGYGHTASPAPVRVIGAPRTVSIAFHPKH